MADFKRVILKDPVSGENLMPVVPEILQYEIVEGTEVAPFEFELTPSIPSGLIAMWSGSSANIPEGWLLCNGENGTPDLRDRFIVGAGNEYDIGATGGEKIHTLTTEEMPSHTHNIINSSGTFYVKTGGGLQGGSGGLETASSSTSAITISSTGGGQAHENRPPYYALCFIMKV